MFPYGLLPPEVQDEVIANLPLGDVINYCLAATGCEPQVRHCHPLWLRLAALLRRLTTDLVYNFGPPHVPTSLLRLQCLDTVRSLTYATIRDLDDPRIKTRELVTRRELNTVVEHLAVDHRRDLISVSFRGNLVKIYPLSRVSFCDHLYSFQLERRWIIRQMHICNGNAVFEVGYWLLPTRRRPEDFTLQFLTYGGENYGGVLANTSFLGRTAVNENFVVAYVSGIWSTDVPLAYSQIIIVPRDGCRYSSTYMTHSIGRGGDIALDGTRLGILDYNSRKSGASRRYRLRSFEVGNPDLPLIAINGEVQMTLIALCRLTLESQLLFDKEFDLLTAHRLSSFYERVSITEVGTDYLRVGNFVASFHGYGKIYVAKLSIDERVEIIRVGQGGGVVIDRFPSGGGHGELNDGLFLHISRPNHYFAGRNLIYVWLRHLLVRQLPN